MHSVRSSVYCNPIPTQARPFRGVCIFAQRTITHILFMKAEKEGFFVVVIKRADVSAGYRLWTHKCVCCAHIVKLSCPAKFNVLWYMLNTGFIYSLISSTFKNSGQTHLPASHISTARFCKHTPAPTACFFFQTTLHTLHCNTQVFCWTHKRGFLGRQVRYTRHKRR